MNFNQTLNPINRGLILKILSGVGLFLVILLLSTSSFAQGRCESIFETRTLFRTDLLTDYGPPKAAIVKESSAGELLLYRDENGQK